MSGALAPAWAADETVFEVTNFSVTAGATADGSSADSGFRSDLGYTVSPATNVVTVRAGYRCASDTGQCTTASATFRLTAMQLDAAVPTPAAADGPGGGHADSPATITYYDGDGNEMASWEGAASFKVEYALGMATGATGDWTFTAKLTTPTPLGPQSGSVVVTPSPMATTDHPSRIRVSGEFPATVTTSTTQTWAEASFLSGVDSDSDSPTNTATLTSTNTGDPADTFTVSWPADPTTKPTGLVVGQLADLTGLAVTGWPSGASSVTVSAWRWTSAATAPTLVTIGTFAAGDAALADLLASLDATTRAGLIGFRLVYRAAAVGTIASGAVSVLSVSVREHGSSNGTPTARSGSVDYATSGDLAADLNTLTVGATATTSAIRGSVTSATSTATASYRVLDPRVYAGSSTTLAALAGGTVYPGGYVLATSTATNWTRRAVTTLALTARPTQAQIDANDAALNPDIADLDSQVFGSGLAFAGFGNGLTGSAPNGLGATTTASAGYRVTLRLTTADGTTDHPIADLAALPTDPTSFGLTSWPQVLGFTLLLDEADGSSVANQGAALSVPYLLQAGSVSTATTYTDHTLATVTLGGDTSAATPRTQASGNRPVTAATITVAAPSVGVAMTKNVREQQVTTSAGSGAEAVLGVTSKAGASGHLPDTMILEDSARAAGGGSTGTAWWNVMQPTAVDTLAVAPVQASVQYYTNTSGEPVWQTFAGTLSALGDTSAWRGMRVVYTRSDAGTFPVDTTQRARITFAVRSTILNSQAWATGTSLDNVAQATSSALVNGLTVTSTVAGARARVVGIAPFGSGESGLGKSLSTTTWIEGNPVTPTATLTWGTAGGQFGSVLVADANGLGSGVDTPATGRTGSFWDTFDLTGIAASTATSDPLMVFDQVADIQVYDVPTATWVSLAAREWTGTAWATLGGARTDVTFNGSSSTAFPYAGAIPAVSFVDSSLRARIGGVRLLVEARSDADRAAAVPATDWRSALLPTLSSGKVAVSDGPSRQIVLQLALRTTSRATGELVNDAFAYTESGPGVLRNDGRVTGYAQTGMGGSSTDLGGPTNPADERTFTLTPAALSAVVTKTWQRTANGSPLTASQLQTLAIPVGGQSADESAWPTATLTATAYSSSTTPVDSLVLAEPADIVTLVGSALPATSPFARFTITDVTTLTASLTGSTGTAVTLYRLSGGVVTADSPTITAAAAANLTAAELADVVGISVAYTGQITSGTGNRATLGLTTRLRATGRVTGTPTAQGDSVTNEVGATVGDDLVCSNETTPTATLIASCAGRKTAAQTASATLTVETASLEAFGTVAVTPADVQRDATDPAVTATLAVQNFGLTDADELQLVAADPRYFNAVGLSTVTVPTLPTGADAARLEVTLTDIAADGTYTSAPTWVAWGSDQGANGSWDLAALAAAAGTTADRVTGVRVRFVDTDGSLLAAPGQGYGQVTLVGALRRTLLTGGLPSATGAEGWTYAGTAEAVHNPAETVRGQVSLRASAVALRTGLDTVTRTTADATFSVHAGAATLTTTKTELNAASRAPGDFVRYRIRVQNTASGATAGDLTGLVVTDVLPEDGSLVFGSAPDGEQPVQVTAAGGGTSPLPEPTVTTADGTVLVTFPADSRLAAGTGVDVLIWVKVASELSTTTVVNAARVTSTTRPVEGAAGGSVVGTTCAAGTYDAATSSCAVSAAPLTVGGANVYVSSNWVRDGDGSSDTARTAGTGACTPRGSGADAAWFRYPCAVVTTAGSTTNWLVQVVSRASVPTGTLLMVDMLPQPGDYPAMSATGSRASTWRPVWDGALPTLVGTYPAGATLAVWTTTADYRAGGLAASASFDPVPGTWTLQTGPMSASAAARVTGFKFVVTYAAADLLGSGESTQVQWSMRTPLSGVSDDTDAWNSFGFLVPADAAAGRPADVTSVPLKAGVRFDLPVVSTPLVAVGDRVWRDLDRDGIQDDGEPGVAGAVVDLYTSGGVWAGETTTDAQGDYLFDGLPAGSYDLRFTLPADLAASSLLTGRDAGSDDLVDSDPDSAGLVSSVALTADTTGQMRAVASMSQTWRDAHPGLAATYVDATRDAGIVWRKVGVGDTVWVDSDRDGVQDSGEPGLPGATVRLLGADAEVLATTTTDATGRYAFDDLDPGQYRVRVELTLAQAARFQFVAAAQGSAAGLDSNVDSTGLSAAFTLTAQVGGQMVTSPGGSWSSAAFVDPTIDAGVVERGVSVGDLVWVDLDQDGVQDAGEPGLPGVELTLTDLAGNPVRDADGALVGPVTTDDDGLYTFGNLLPGTYRVHQDPATVGGYRPTTVGVGTAATGSSTGTADSVALVGGGSDPTLDFGFVPLYAIGDRVWYDQDRDGVQDDGEPAIPGVTVTLLDGGGVEVASTVTDAEGHYVFDELAAGTYRLRFELGLVPAVTTQFTAASAGAGSDDSDAVAQDVRTALTAPFVLGAATPGLRATTVDDGLVAPFVDPTWDAGVRDIPVQVGDLVWLDADGDGVQDEDEAGLPGVALTLTTPDGHDVTDAAGNPVAPVTTDADGRYAFTNLVPGTYVVLVDRVASGSVLAGYGPAPAQAGDDRAVDSSTWTATSAALAGGQADTTLDFGLVLADDVQLALDKDVLARVGDTVTWKLTVLSAGLEDAYAGFDVVDTLPDSLRYVSAGGDGFACSVAGQVVTCRYDDALPAGSTASLTVVTTLVRTGVEVRNVAEATVAGHPYRFEVLASTDQAWSQPTSAELAALARTGADVRGLTALAVSLLVTGAVVLVARRRRWSRG